MRKTLTAAAVLLAIAAIFVAVAAAGTGSTKQHVRIEVKGTDPFSYELKRGGALSDVGSVTFCCWRSWDVTRAGAKVEVTNPLLTLDPESRGPGRLKIRERIEWTPLPDGWAVFTGTWKVVGGQGAYARFSGHGRVAGTWAPETDPDRALRLRLFGFLEPK